MASALISQSQVYKKLLLLPVLSHLLLLVIFISFCFSAAPEVLAQKPYSKAVDCWSIGVITYILWVEAKSIPFFSWVSQLVYCFVHLCSVEVRVEAMPNLLLPCGNSTSFFLRTDSPHHRNKRDVGNQETERRWKESHFSLLCASSYPLFFVFFSCLQVSFDLPLYILFRFLPHHAVMFQLWLCPFAAAVKFLTLFCSFPNALRCEGQIDS